MIFTDKDKSSIAIQDEYFADVLELSKWEDDNFTEYFLSTYISCFYSEYDGFFNKLKKRIKASWNILIHGTYRLQEICLPEKEFNELKEIIKDYK